MNLNINEWKKNMELNQNNICLDVRTVEEFNQGFIENSINRDFYNSIDFMKFLEKSEKDNNYYVYCRSGIRSHAACEIMTDMGFNNVYNLEGGFLEWVKSGFSVNE
tara:strand:+ start:201 stop:518 length:318 start_codon:yes stop_codon:yes gene_type:complete